MTETEIPVTRKKGKPISHSVRLIRLLLEIAEADQNSTADKIQASKLALDAIGKRKPVHRKSDADKLREEVLKSALPTKKKTTPPEVVP